MTDGPYAPPSMSRQWNEFGRAILRPAFEEDVAPCFRRALLNDAVREQVRELSGFLKEALSAKEPDLFGGTQKAALDDARAQFLAPMAQSAIDHCEGALRDGQNTDDAIHDGVTACIKERARDSFHTLEAHHMSQEGAAKANEAQSRCEALFPQTDWTAIAGEVQTETPQEHDVSGSASDRTEVGPPKGSP